MPKDAEPALFSEGELAPAPGRLEQEAFDAWNEVAAKVGWPKAIRLNPDRVKRLRKAVVEAGGLLAWRAALERAGRSSFLTGRAGRTGGHENWVMDLEFICRPAKLVKIQEGGFDDANAPERVAAAPVQLPADPHADDRRKLRNYRPGGNWPAHYGARPESADCRLAAPVLEEWRSINRVTVAAPVRETLEERLAGMERSYRKIGNHAKADSLLIELAQVRGEELVTLPPRPEPRSLQGTRVDVRSGQYVEGLASNAGGKFNVAKRNTSAAVDVEPEYDALPEAEDFGDE